MEENLVDGINPHSQQRSICAYERPGSDIRLAGYLKKLKTMKMKYFVLRSTSSSGPARLEYYDSQKRYNSGLPPKRSIHLHTCFNINCKADIRYKYIIVIFTKEDCFEVMCSNEKEQNNWLSTMLHYHNEYIADGDHREHYDYVWKVHIQSKGLGQTMNFRGPYRLCINHQNICLFKLNAATAQFVFQLETIRCVAHNDSLFRIEVGKFAPTGEGEIWMHVENGVIAQQMHEAILNFMRNSEHQLDKLDFRHRTASENFSGSGRARSSTSHRPLSANTGGAWSCLDMKHMSEPCASTYVGSESVKSHAPFNFRDVHHVTNILDLSPSTFRHGGGSDQTDIMPYMEMQSWDVTLSDTTVTTDGYFDMSSQLNKGGYMSMSSSCKGRLDDDANKIGWVPPNNRISQCQLTSDSQPPIRTYSLGSRPTRQNSKASGYIDMSGSSHVSCGSRCCSAPHLTAPPHHLAQCCGVSSQHCSRLACLDASGHPRQQVHFGNIECDDSEEYMGLDFWRSRTASESYSCRPVTSPFCMHQGQKSIQDHRPRSSSHSQCSRPARHRSGASSHLCTRKELPVQVSFNSSPVLIAFSKPLSEMSQVSHSKESHLTLDKYVDMFCEKRRVIAGKTSEKMDAHSGYVDMALGKERLLSSCRLLPNSIFHGKTGDRSEMSNCPVMTIGQLAVEGDERNVYANVGVPTVAEASITCMSGTADNMLLSVTADSSADDSIMSKPSNTCLPVASGGLDDKAPLLCTDRMVVATSINTCACDNGVQVLFSSSTTHSINNRQKYSAQPQKRYMPLQGSNEYVELCPMGASSGVHVTHCFCDKITVSGLHQDKTSTSLFSSTYRPSKVDNVEYVELESITFSSVGNNLEIYATTTSVGVTSLLGCRPAAPKGGSYAVVCSQPRCSFPSWALLPKEKSVDVPMSATVLGQLLPLPPKRQDYSEVELFEQSECQVVDGQSRPFVSAETSHVLLPASLTVTTLSTSFDAFPAGILSPGFKSNATSSTPHSHTIPFSLSATNLSSATCLGKTTVHSADMIRQHHTEPFQGYPCFEPIAGIGSAKACTKLASIDSGYVVFGDLPALTGNTVISDLPALSGNTEISDLPALSDNTVISYLPALSDNTVISDLPALSDNTVISDLPALSGNTVTSDLPALSGNTVISDLPALSGNTVISAHCNKEACYDQSGISQQRCSRPHVSDDDNDVYLHQAVCHMVDSCSGNGQNPPPLPEACVLSCVQATSCSPTVSTINSTSQSDRVEGPCGMMATRQGTTRGVQPESDNTDHVMKSDHPVINGTAASIDTASMSCCCCQSSGLIQGHTGLSLLSFLDTNCIQH